jgi:hypothetical protein
MVRQVEQARSVWAAIMRKQEDRDFLPMACALGSP